MRPVSPASARYGEHPDMHDNRPCEPVIETRFARLVSSSEQEESGTQTLSHPQDRSNVNALT